MARKTFHVVWSIVFDRWAVHEIIGENNAHVVLRRSKTKASAIKFACSKARFLRTVGQVVIHREDGTIENEFIFGTD